jgi:hypothetical protein
MANVSRAMKDMRLKGPKGCSCAKSVKKPSVKKSSKKK